MSAERARLLRAERWRWLAELAEEWFEAPLTDADGASRAEIDAVADELGAALPLALAEWLALVGHRVQEVQDTPASLRTLRRSDDGIEIWRENQSVWVVTAPCGGEDPTCSIEGAEWQADGAPLVQVLHGMMLSELIVGAWSGEGVGPLGVFKPGVVGGFHAEVTAAEIDAVRTRYPALRVPSYPFLNEEPRGERGCLLRGDEYWGSGLEWAVSTKQAAHELAALIPLEAA